MLKGIDVSDNQGTIDWRKVKASGIQVAILRSVRGSGKADYQFENNFKGCRDNGIAIGVYKYSYAATVADAVNEAKQVVTLLNARQLECKVWLDMEDSSQRVLSKDALTAIASAFKNIITGAGYEFGIYCNQDWYNNVLNAVELNKICSHWWIARYGTNNGKAQENYKPPAARLFAWQYTSRGSVNGISGNVDMDEIYGNVETISKTDIEPQQDIHKYRVGQKVRFSTCYLSSTDPVSRAIPTEKISRDNGMITRIREGAANPYLIDDGLCWCNADDIREVLNTISTTDTAAQTEFSVGQTVRFSTCYASSTDPVSRAIPAGNMSRDNGTITRIREGAINPYLIDDGLCWCNAGDIREILR